jgi:hypothetical protein
VASKLNTVEGIANAATVTAANSGGASGNAWNSTASTSATLISDNTHAAHGTQSVKLATTTSVVDSMTWTLTASLTWFFRVYIWIDSIVAASNPSIIRMRGGSDTIQAMRITFSDTRHLQIRDGSNSLVSTMTGVFAFGAWYRVEGFATPGTGTTTGAGEIKLFLGDSTTTVTSGTLTTSGQNFNGTTLTSGNIDAFNFGQVAAMANLPAEWMDDFAASNVAYIGPQVQTLSPSSILTLEVVPTPTLTPGPVTLSPASIASLQVVPTPTLTPGSVTLHPTSIGSQEAFGTPTLTPGSVTLHPTSIATQEAFGTPFMLPGAVILSPATIPTSEVVPDPSLTPGTTILTPASIGSQEAFETPTITGSSPTLFPDTIPSEEAFGTPGITPAVVTLRPATIASSLTIPTPGISQAGNRTISMPSITSLESFGPVIVARISPRTGACCDGEQFHQECCTVGLPVDEEE